MGEGNIFSLFTLAGRGGVPHPRSVDRGGYPIPGWGGGYHVPGLGGGVPHPRSGGGGVPCPRSVGGWCWTVKVRATEP